MSARIQPPVLEIPPCFSSSTNTSTEDVPVPLNLLAEVNAFRTTATAFLPEKGRGELGQFLTPPPVARLLASLLHSAPASVSILDAGAGVGSLCAAAVEVLCQLQQLPERIHVTAYEIDALLIPYLRKTLDLCHAHCAASGIAFSATVHHTDFLRDAASLLESNLLTHQPKVEGPTQHFDVAILNPPYRKINAESPERTYLRRIGIETTNLYTGFVFAAMRLLAPGGELVAITPRSFCNGKYFLPFRRAFLGEMKLRHLHIFETRQEAFREDAVLQETLVFKAVKTKELSATVTVTSGVTAEAELSRREVPYTDVINPADPEMFIHVAPRLDATGIAEQINSLPSALPDLGLNVSTGRVVDFRATAYLRAEPGADTVPLIWPLHMNGENGSEGGGYVAWPHSGAKKPNAVVSCAETASQLVPDGNYVLVKRFSSKEQKRRITAAVFEGDRLKSQNRGVGFENHLNYYHDQGKGMSLELARGLALFLNSTVVDEYFRLYSGHTQVNATDLKSLRYPTRSQLLALGRHVGEIFPAQKQVDAIVESELFTNGK